MDKAVDFTVLCCFIPKCNVLYGNCKTCNTHIINLPLSPYVSWFSAKSVCDIEHDMAFLHQLSCLFFELIAEILLVLISIFDTVTYLKMKRNGYLTFQHINC